MVLQSCVLYRCVFCCICLLVIHESFSTFFVKPFLSRFKLQIIGYSAQTMYINITSLFFCLIVCFEKHVCIFFIFYMPLYIDPTVFTLCICLFDIKNDKCLYGLYEINSHIYKVHIWRVQYLYMRASGRLNTIVAANCSRQSLGWACFGCCSLHPTVYICICVCDPGNTSVKSIL